MLLHLRSAVVKLHIAEDFVREEGLSLRLLRLPILDPVNAVDYFRVLVVDPHEVCGVFDRHVLFEKFYELYALLVAHLRVLAFAAASHRLLVRVLIKHRAIVNC